jgi:hypothetical protein
MKTRNKVKNEEREISDESEIHERLKSRSKVNNEESERSKNSKVKAERKHKQGRNEKREKTKGWDQREQEK